VNADLDRYMLLFTICLVMHTMGQLTVGEGRPGYIFGGAVALFVIPALCQRFNKRTAAVVSAIVLPILSFIDTAPK
jgi:hypothetical protein